MTRMMVPAGMPVLLVPDIGSRRKFRNFRPGTKSYFPGFFMRSIRDWLNVSALT